MPEQPVATITIILDQRGQINVTGPIENKLLMFGLLRMAEQVVNDFKPSSILQASPSDVMRIDKKQ
jgi:hypothetical protein